jgi:hypothetical protein
MPPLSLLSDMGYMMRRCWRNWRHMTWKPSLRSSIWPTNVPELSRAVHGTRHHRLELPRRVAQVLPPRATTTTRRRRTTVRIGRSLLLRSSQLRLGAETSAASAHRNREVTVGHALSIPTVAIAPQNAERSSSSRSASASGASRPPMMARRFVADLARRRLTKVTRPRENETSGISPPSRSLRTSSLETLTPVTTTTAAKSCT